MKKKLLTGLMFGLSLALLVGVANATVITTYTDFSAWQASVATYKLEDFNDTTLLLSYSSTSDGHLENGYFYDRPTATNGGTTWSFGETVNSFGGLWDLSGPGGSGMGLILTMTDGTSTFIAPQISNTTNNFWGFVADENFTSAYVAAGTQSGIAETYHIDNLVFGSTSSTPVPEPATMLLLGLGMVGLAGIGRKKKKASI